MRNAGKNGARVGSATPPLAPPSMPESEPPQPPRIILSDLELRLNQRDLWIIANGVRMTPWGGGEDRVTRLHRIHTTLRLAKVNTHSSALPAAGAKPIEVVKLQAADVELIIRVLCGEADKAFSGEAGPTMSELVVRLREQIKNAVREAVARQQAVKA